MLSSAKCYHISKVPFTRTLLNKKPVIVTILMMLLTFNLAHRDHIKRLLCTVQTFETTAVTQVLYPHHSLTHCRRTSSPPIFLLFQPRCSYFILIKLSLFSNFIRKKWKEKGAFFTLFGALCVSCLRMICSCVSKVAVMPRLMMDFFYPGSNPIEDILL